MLTHQQIGNIDVFSSNKPEMVHTIAYWAIDLFTHGRGQSRTALLSWSSFCAELAGEMVNLTRSEDLFKVWAGLGLVSLSAHHERGGWRDSLLAPLQLSTNPISDLGHKHSKEELRRELQAPLDHKHLELGLLEVFDRGSIGSPALTEDFEILARIKNLWLLAFGDDRRQQLQNILRKDPTNTVVRLSELRQRIVIFTDDLAGQSILP